MSPELMARVFEPHFTTKDGNRYGLGLGLAMVKSIVNQHHGQITVNSERGRGSDFVITLPLDREPEVQEEAPHE